jgi:hypothetical protein
MAYYKRFLDGLQKYNISKQDIDSGKWSYCGGNKGRHLNYFNLKYKNTKIKLPRHKENCVCCHDIRENCYITNGDDIIVLGNCCIKRFLPNDKSLRTCGKCSKPHKNITVNRCNDCRYGLCDKCDIQIKKKYHKCTNCYPDICNASNIVKYCQKCNNTHYNIVNKCDECRKGICDECDIKISEKFKKRTLCYICKNKDEIIYLNISYSKKDKAKNLGAFWNNNKKKWYFLNSSENKEELLNL